MSVLKSVIPGSDLGTMGALGKFVDLPDVRQSLYAAYVAGTALGGIRTALDGTSYIRDKTGAGRHAKIIRPANELDVVCMGYMSGTTFTVTSSTGGPIKPGMMPMTPGVAANTMILSNGTGIGGAGTYTLNISQTLYSSGAPGPFTAAMLGSASLFVDPAHFLELPFSARDVSSINGEMTVVAIAMNAATGSNLPLVSDYGAASAYIIADAPAAGGAQSWTNDGTASASTTTAGGSTLTRTKPSVFGTIHTRTRSDAYWRLTGVGAGSYWTTASKADGVVGGTAKLRLGSSYDASGSFAMPGQIFAALIYNKALTQAEHDATVYPALAALATAQAWGTV